MKYNFFTNYVTRFTYLNLKPTKVSKLVFWIRFKLDKKWRSSFDINRYVRVNSLPNEYLEFSENLPEIDLLLVTKSGDTELLTKVIPLAIQNSENRISRITIIVPENSILPVQELLKTKEYFGIVKVRNENEIVPDHIRMTIKKEFNSLYGWVLAQFLKIWYVAQSDAKGVLVLDADTLLLKKRKFLFNSGNQILTPTLEYNLPYYEFLKKFDNFFGLCTDSFISHHMLMQPDFAREALKYWGNSMDNMLRDVLENYDKNASSPFCLCFEVYSQYMVTHQPSKIKLVKWSNMSVQREKLINSNYIPNINAYKRKFNSISLHSWL